MDILFFWLFTLAIYFATKELVPSFFIVSILFVIWYWANMYEKKTTENAQKKYYIESPDNIDRNSSYKKECVKPENPYWDDSWHDAWWKWWEEWNHCDWNSDSFIEGCEEYEIALSEYEYCMN